MIDMKDTNDPTPISTDEQVAGEQAVDVSAQVERISASSIKSTEQAARTLRRLFDVARPEAVFSKPVKVGERTLITASEVSVGMALGFGMGGGMGAGATTTGEIGAGGGGGGGGLSLGRPVAVIAVGPDGVEVQPVVDPTKIALAFITTVGALALALMRMRRVR